jgi:Spy/CpxP family protein refolding chaperone
MLRKLASRLLSWATLLSLAVAFATMTQSSFGAEKKIKRGRNRIAAYEQVATPEQREKITKIEDEYKPKIAELHSQIKDLKAKLQAMEKERDEKVAAVLTPDQKKQADDASKKGKHKGGKAAEAASPPPAKDKPGK